MNAEGAGNGAAVVVEGILFRSEADGFQVVRVAPESGGNTFVAAGPFPEGTAPGDLFALEGAFEDHPRFGRRFRVTTARARVPTSAAGIRRYLGSGRIKGIGKRLASRLVSHFGDRTLAVLESEPERVLEVPGVGRSRLEEIRRVFSSGREQREALVFLQGLGLGPGASREIWRKFGTATVSRVRRDPYALAREIDGIGFLSADRIALALGTAPDAEVRLRAGLEHVLREAADQGHVCLHAPELDERAAALLRADPGGIASALGAAVGTGELRSLRPRAPGDAEAAEPRIYLPALEALEGEAARRLLELADGARRPAPPWEAPAEAGLSPEQGDAVRTLLATKAGLLTGGPGVGKTTVLREVVRAYVQAGFRVALASPTGRAARRLASATGHEAKTLHRLLGIVPGAARPAASEALEADVLVVDEASMLDLPLMVRVLRRLDPRTILILVGDPHQLPSVGPGSVLADLLGSERFDVVRLSRIFRQAAGSSIAANAHRILRGEMPEFPPRSEESDSFFVERESPEEGAEVVLRLAVERIPARFGLDPRDGVQILCPMHRGAAGTAALNARVQAALGAGRPALAWRDREFREGDRVMMTRNDYELGVMNGEMGSVVAVLPGGTGLRVRFDTECLDATGATLDALVPAYAITVHKSQGGEFPAVIVPLFMNHYLMLRRNVIYTAVTRARSLLVIVGSRRALVQAVRDDRQLRRRGELLRRLRGIPLESAPPGD